MRDSLDVETGQVMATKTYMAKPGEIAPTWHLVDATDQVVGRLAVKIARILMGKHRVEYTPHVAMGDFVVVVNAAKVKVTGSAKLSQRTYQRFSGYPGGQRSVPLKEMLATRPEKVIEEARVDHVPLVDLALSHRRIHRLYPPGRLDQQLESGPDVVLQTGQPVP